MHGQRPTHSVHMPEHAGWFGGMAGRAFTQCARMPLQFHKLDRVVVLSAGRDGVRAIVTPLPEHAAMAYRLAIERQAGVVSSAVTPGTAALGLIQPWVR